VVRTFSDTSPYADDVVEYFVQKSIANGIDIIRIFDCMNDLRNLETAVKAARKRADMLR
jgi:oxaloacetate decarboxylase alpha subunit